MKQKNMIIYRRDVISQRCTYEYPFLSERYSFY